MNRLFLIVLIIPLLNADFPDSKTFNYKEFVIGDDRKKVSNILTKQKYSKYSIYYDNNDRYVSGIKVKAENSIKIVISRYMEKEEILLVFDNNDILFDIYSRKRPMDIRDYIDYRVYMIGIYGKPVEEQIVKEQHISTWRLNRKRHAVYLIYDSADRDLIINIRDTYLNMRYSQYQN